MAKVDDNATPEQVRATKDSTLEAVPQQSKIQIHPGNTAVLTVSFLNQINEKAYKTNQLLERIVELLEDKHG